MEPRKALNFLMKHQFFFLSIALAGLALTSCETSSSGSSYPTYYSSGYYDDFWYNGVYYDDPDCIGRPPGDGISSRPHPSHPIARPGTGPSARPLPSYGGSMGGGYGGGMGGGGRGGMGGGGRGGRR